MKLRKLEAGFTLVELMVVVAIIGILLVIGVPQYAKFQAKARTVEIKNLMGAVYAAETSFAAENNSFTACLGQIGFNRDGAKQYYWIGYNATPNAAGCGPAGNRSCLEYQWFNNAAPGAAANWVLPPAGGGTCVVSAGSTYFAGTVAEGAPLTQANIPLGTMTGNTAAGASAAFTVFGVGRVNRNPSVAGTVDTWQIDNTKQLVNTVSGI